ncbi:AfsR/SARP family transcriptional regulator [Actinokineospora globicatena]|uniref:AfsR/SARP family transcriptional regulator n=1 Tax=Actinokineospora globicatena TaxID=103729 RepID=UPI0020A5ACAF|nr:BTAD domain-containing putative transcriptional regulator [Actinokineospora globicatena]MCP2302996.1 DNA-binding transcriptional activator of the SARP family [Actinokineospora globicatena]GLW79896.1 SARP family transcriptional regulator [Actinokineospora globicatena]GLW85694.1 SARP family transcriptional regulator [Actinokineospora globicatena]
MRVLVLGPIVVRGDGGVVPVGGAKPRTLLAALVTQPRTVVSIEQLISALWDEDPPRSATPLVHTYVSALRRALAAAGSPSVLATQPPGYRLDLRPQDSDLETFEQLLRQGRSLERAGDHVSAAAAYGQARELWRGQAFGGVDAAFARTRASGLEEDRLSIEEGLARCELATQRPDEAGSRMARLVADHPLREEAHGLLMRALYEGGRQADALAVYRDARKHLRDELGVEPGEKLRQVHTGVLSGNLQPLVARESAVTVLEVGAEVDPGETVGAAPPYPRVTYTAPRHLPPDLADFVGRADQLTAVRRVAGRSGADGHTATPTVVVTGFGGAGKSALAVHSAHLLREDYPDGQLFADLRGVDPELGVRDALRRFLGALGVPAADLPDTVADRVELYRRMVAGRALVVVLDNVVGEHQVRPLLPGSPHCLVIVTSRSRLTGLEGAEVVELDFFDTDASTRMLAAIIGQARAAADPAAAATIARLCGGVPLAIRAAAAKLLARPHWPLRALADRLSDVRRRLDELAVGDLAVRSSLQLNHADLDHAQRAAFHLLALLDLPDFGAWLAAPLLDIGVDEAEDIVEHLVDLRLLEVVGVDTVGRVRYRFHDLVRLFAIEQTTGDPVGPAIDRMLATWLSLVEIGTASMPRVTLGLRPSRTDLDLDTRQADEVRRDPTGWLTAETATVIRVVERGHELGADSSTTMLMVALLGSPFAARNEFDGWQRILDVAMASARTSGDRAAEAKVHAGLGHLRYEQDDFPAATTHFTQAWQHAEAVGDDLIHGVARVGLGTVHRELGEFDLAVAHLVAGSELAERGGDQSVVAAAQYGLGAIHRDLGDLPAAFESMRTCLALYRDLEDQRGEGLALRGLGLCHRAVGELDQAVDLSRQAESVLHAAGDPLGAAYAQQSLAKALLRQGSATEAADVLSACHEVFLRNKDRFGVALAVRTMGEAALAAGDDEAAGELLAVALAGWQELALPLWEARTLRDLAAAEPDSAHEHWTAARDLFTTLNAREATELAELDPAGWREQVRSNL